MIWAQARPSSGCFRNACAVCVLAEGARDVNSAREKPMSQIPPSEGPARGDAPGTGAGGGEGVGLTVTEARGAVRTGRNIWVLVISLTLAIVVLLGYWLLHAPRFHAVNNERVVRTQNLTGYPVQGASARPSPAPDEPAGNSQ
jgi:hypothetical protein